VTNAGFGRFLAIFAASVSIAIRTTLNVRRSRVTAAPAPESTGVVAARVKPSGVSDIIA
jgi:hypothetical protein